MECENEKKIPLILTFLRFTFTFLLLSLFCAEKFFRMRFFYRPANLSVPPWDFFTRVWWRIRKDWKVEGMNELKQTDVTMNSLHKDLRAPDEGCNRQSNNWDLELVVGKNLAEDLWIWMINQKKKFDFTWFGGENVCLFKRFLNLSDEISFFSLFFSKNLI